MPTSDLSRSLVYGQRGMVCSNSPLAAAAGIKVLQEGGNAFDAALAVAATEAVTLVPLCGLGGDSFVLLYEAATARSRCPAGTGEGASPIVSPAGSPSSVEYSDPSS